MEIFYTISVSLLLLNCAKAQPEPWICTFQEDECDISQSLEDDSHWFIPYAKNRYYRPAINRVGDTNGTSATFILPPASYPGSGQGVLSFRFRSYTAYPPRVDRYLEVTTCEDGEPVLILAGSASIWYFREIRITCGSIPVKISFTAFRGYSQTHIAVDDINVIEILTTTAAAEVVTSATPQVTRGQTLTPSISPSLTSDATTKYNMSTEIILENVVKVETGLSLVPILISTLIPLSAISIFVIIVCLLCRRKWLKHGTNQGVAAFGDSGDSPGMRDKPISDFADCQGGSDPYIALTTPRDGPTFQVYEPLREVNSQGDGYEVPINGTNGQTGPEYDTNLHTLQVHLETDYEIKHEYQDLTNSEPQVQPETEYEAIHEYEDPGMI